MTEQLSNRITLLESEINVIKNQTKHLMNTKQLIESEITNLHTRLDSLELSVKELQEV